MQGAQFRGHSGSLRQTLRKPAAGADDGSVAISSRPYPFSGLLRPTLALAAALSAALAIVSAPARAVVTNVGSVNAGVQPRSVRLFTRGATPAEFANASGHPIVAANKTYAIYWDPTDHYHGDWQHVIDTFFQKMGASSGSLANVFSVDAQYTDAANQHALYSSAFMGAYTDTNIYPAASGCTDPSPPSVADRIGPVLLGAHTPVCLTDKQVQEELEQFIAQHSLQKGMETIFYLITPPGVTVCLDAGGETSGHCSDFVGSMAEIEADEKAKEEKEEKSEVYVEPENYKSYQRSFCSYHSDISNTSPTTGDSNTILYGVIPWAAGGLGDGHLAPPDSGKAGFECQDGGFDPTSKPIEQREKKKEAKKNETKEKEEPLTKEEQEKQELKEALEGPHQQEPNQVPCPSPDGSCDTGLADLIVNQIAVEQQNIVTNPLLNAWQDSKKNEVTDECRDFFAPALGGSVAANEETGGGTLFNQSFAANQYYLNDAFNLAALKLPYPAVPCISGVRLEPKFTAPDRANANEIVSFDGMESNITLDAGEGFSGGVEHSTYASYTWDFGDGSAPISGFAPGAPTANSPGVSPCAAAWETPCAASTFHSYQYGGTYNVTLTVTDVGGNTASVTEPITVGGAPAPAPPAPGGSSSPGSSSPVTPVVPVSPQSPASPGAPTVTVTVTPPPVVTGLVSTKSLKKALSGGLTVRYTANEQVAGSIQVLLESGIAKRLGIHGASATGLPKGSPPSVVVGAAVLVTTKGGQGTLHIKFSSHTASRLKGVRKLKLTLRLFARNASRQGPQTTTALSTVMLNP
jgi:hypothetical protein